METSTRKVLGLLLLSTLTCLPASAMGPVDGEVGAAWWHNSFSSDDGTSTITSDAGAPGYRAELWFLQRYGVRAERYSSELDDFDLSTSNSTSLDFMWRAFSPSENNYFALGLGWQEIDLGTIGLAGDSSGIRLALEGRVALGGLFYLYGQGYYLPSLDDTEATDPGLGQFEDMDGHILEAGISWKLAPFVGMRAGYRLQNVSFTRTVLDTQYEGEAEADGFLLGLCVRF